MGHEITRPHLSQSIPLRAPRPWQASAACLVGTILCLVAVSCTTSPTTIGRTPGFPRSILRQGLGPIRTIVVDAGHGGHDPGASHHGLREKDLTLDISKRLRNELKAAGLSVVMTRDQDQFIGLSQRPALANRLKAELFVSVHVNANRRRSVAGVEVYYPRTSVIHRTPSLPPGVSPSDVALPNATIKRILWDLVFSRTRHHSAEMAEHICDVMHTRLQVACRGVKGARFVVLKEAAMPAVLVEVGYVSNRPEAARLAKTSYRQAVAQAIAEGVISYIRSFGVQHI